MIKTLSSANNNALKSDLYANISPVLLMENIWYYLSLLLLLLLHLCLYLVYRACPPHRKKKRVTSLSMQLKCWSKQNTAVLSLNEWNAVEERTWKCYHTIDAPYYPNRICCTQNNSTTTLILLGKYGWQPRTSSKSKKTKCQPKNIRVHIAVLYCGAISKCTTDK